MRDMCGRLCCLSPHIKEYPYLTAAIGSFTLCSSIGTSASSVEGQSGKAAKRQSDTRGTKYDPPHLRQVLGTAQLRSGSDLDFCQELLRHYALLLLLLSSELRPLYSRTKQVQERDRDVYVAVNARGRQRAILAYEIS